MRFFQRSKRRRSWLLALACILAAAVFSGCQSLSYYRQAIAGEYQILANQKPIQSLIDDPQTPADLKTKFRQVIKIREFADRELKLPVDAQYLKYVDLRR